MRWWLLIGRVLNTMYGELEMCHQILLVEEDPPAARTPVLELSVGHLKGAELEQL